MEQAYVQEQLTNALKYHEWIIGAVNYDEDLHFSSYYLRASMQPETQGLYPGYTHLISFYQGFNECYYLLKEECIHNAKEIISHAENNIGWLSTILDNIRINCKSLWSLFNDSEDIDQFHRLSNDELLNIYKRHNDTHKTLYKWARLPEALDRGVSYFSNYLHKLTREATCNEKSWHTTFNKLTQPVTPSILSESLDELTEIALIILKDNLLKDYFLSSPRKARMVLPVDLFTKIRKYYNKWKYLNYHGYGSRDLGDIATIMERISRTISSTINGHEMKIIRAELEERRSERDKLLDQIGFEMKHRQFFEIYSEIGATKLLRRYAQLRNFFYLDLLIAEISQRLQATEWQIRNMLPEEIINAFKSANISDEIKKRSLGCAYCIINDQTTFITGPKAKEIFKRMESATNKQSDKKILKGVVACQGKVTGTCKVIIRADEDAEKHFREGDVLVSQSTDPDLLNLLKIAGAVVTEQGGVTSHASLICRELGIPAIVGIPGLLDNVANGDTLEVDAHNGIVRIIDATDEIPSVVISFSNAYNEVIGGKARGLLTLLDIGCSVPEFILLNTEKVRDLLGCDNLSAIDHLKEWIIKRLKIQYTDKLAVRSSSIEEDTEETSSAGRYESFLEVSLDMLQNVLRDFLKINNARSTGTYNGSIIIERMLNADFSGVCLTKDYRLGKENVFVIETMPGSNHLITQGKIRPVRFYIDCVTRDISIEQSLDFEISIESIDIWAIVNTCSIIEEKFGCPVDIEWALTNTKLYILQARPLVTK